MLIILFGHLWVAELTNILSLAFKFTLRCMQPDIAGIVDANGILPPPLLTPAENLPLVSLTPVVPIAQKDYRLKSFVCHFFVLYFEKFLFMYLVNILQYFIQ
jgi:hypothetical protein